MIPILTFFAARQAIEYILSIGRKKIALLNGPLEYKYAKERLRGFASTLEENGVHVNQDWILL